MISREKRKNQLEVQSNFIVDIGKYNYLYFVIQHFLPTSLQNGSQFIELN